MIIQIEPEHYNKLEKVKSWTLHTDIFTQEIPELNQTAKDLIAFAYKYDMEPLSEPEIDHLEKWGDEEITLSMRVQTIKGLPEKLPEGVFLGR